MKVASLFKDEMDRLRKMQDDPETFAAIAHALGQLLTVSHTLRALQARPPVLAEIVASLSELIEQIDAYKRPASITPYPAREFLSGARTALVEAASLLDHTFSSTKTLQIVIPTELLYQAQATLYPAERMLVIGGRREGNRVVWTASFDVTGSRNGGHVRADPLKLGDALFMMDKAGAHLAAWIHSHPGLGAEATHPSPIDDRQHADWLCHYSSHLVGAIFVADGHFRLWGTAIEEDQVDIRLQGKGLQKVKGDEYVYRLD